MRAVLMRVLWPAFTFRLVRFFSSTITSFSCDIEQVFDKNTRVSLWVHLRCKQNSFFIFLFFAAHHLGLHGQRSRAVHCQGKIRGEDIIIWWKIYCDQDSVFQLSLLCKCIFVTRKPFIIRVFFLNVVHCKVSIFLISVWKYGMTTLCISLLIRESSERLSVRFTFFRLEEKLRSRKKAHKVQRDWVCRLHILQLDD